MTKFATNPILPFQGANSVVAIFPQGDAIGLDYIGLSARKLCNEKITRMKAFTGRI
jgi:hypothetical protein